ncbi:MAG: DUF4765 family protein [Bacilli bacterium]|nr:DUF4765 family protein [Bacilli bacterium]
MKNKILLPILLLASMSVVACNPGNNGSQSQGSSENTQISSEEPTTSSQQEQPSSQQGTTSSQQPGTSSQQGGQSSSQAPSSSKGGSSSSQTPSSNPVVYGVKILNKDQLTGDWYKGTTRDLNIELSPAANALLEMQKKNLTVTSSDTSKVAVTGLGLTAVGKGQVTITVKYHEAVDTVTVNILSNSAIDKYGTAHEGTLEDPFTNEDAIKVTKASNYEGEDYYIKGKVASFYHAPGVKKGDKYVYGRTDGACSYFLEPATAGGEQFEVYKCYKEGSGEASYLTEDDIWVGGEAVAHGKLTKYNAQCETSAAIYANCTGNKPASRQIVTKEFANVIADGNKLADGGDSYDFWKFQGYVNTRSGNDYYLTATKGEELTTDTFKTKAIQLYFYEPASAEIAGKLLDGAKVEVTMIVKNYHSQMENLLPLENSDITVVEAGEEWKVPEPKVNVRSLADFIAGENTKAVAYFVTAQIKSFKDGESKDKYGNMYLTDGTNDLQIYGSTYTASALAWNNVNSYSFTNPQDFLTNEKSSALKVGDTITMKLIRADYTKDDKTTIEASGIILEGESSIVPEPKVEERSLADFIAGENTKAVAYFVTAQIKSWKDATSAKDKYGNMFLTDGTNDLQIYGSSATASALKWNDEDAYVFTNPQDFLGNATTAALNIGDTITMKLIRADYIKDDKTTIEATGIIVTDDGGQTENVPEPTVATKSLADFIAGENTAAVAYTVTAEVKSWKNATSAKDKYGNMYLTDGTNDLQIYGSSATASALTWNNVDSYVFSNPQDFLTNATTAALNIGDTVTMKLIRADYTDKDGKTTIEATGIITKVEAGDGGGTQTQTASIAKYGFTSQADATSSSITKEVATSIFTKTSGTDVFDSVTACTNVYQKATGGSGDNAFEISNIFKIGKSKNAGSVTLKLKHEVSKIVLVGDSWTKTSSIDINGKTVTGAFADNIISKSVIVNNKLTNAGTLTFEFAATDTITISVGNSSASANFGVVLESIEFFAAI